jgi:hypothetical protein
VRDVKNCAQNPISGDRTASQEHLICSRRQHLLVCGHLIFRSAGLPAASKKFFPYRRNTRCCGHVRVDLQVVNRISDRKCVKHRLGRKRKTMFLAIGFVLLLLWLGGFFVFHVTAFFIHILLILAVVSIIFHFMRGTASVV